MCPLSLYEFIKKEQVDGYEVKLEGNNKIYNQLSDNTITFIAYLNMNYWCSKEDKEKLLAKYKENDDYIEKIANEKYNPEDLFNNQQNEKEDDKEEMAMVEYKKDSIFIKIRRLIEKIFRV